MKIHTAAVLGAGVMGAQIAAHLANAGVRVRLLDVSRDAALGGLERAKRLKPDPFFTADVAALIQEAHNRVKAQCAVELELEVELRGEWSIFQ